jgi:hypothetical protein
MLFAYSVDYECFVSQWELEIVLAEAAERIQAR